MELIQRISLLHIQTVEHFFFTSSTAPVGMIMTVHLAELKSVICSVLLRSILYETCMLVGGSQE